MSKSLHSEMTPAEIAERISKLVARPILGPKSRKEIRDLSWILKVLSEEGQKHECPDYFKSYSDRALRTEHTRPFATDVNGKPDLKLSQLLHAAMGMVTEAAEIMDALKKSIVYGRPLDEANLVEENGDASWYQALMQRTLGVTQKEVCEKNVRKLEIRYKNSVFSSKDATERDLDAERAVFEEKK